MTLALFLAEKMVKKELQLLSTLELVALLYELLFGVRFPPREELFLLFRRLITSEIYPISDKANTLWKNKEKKQ